MKKVIASILIRLIIKQVLLLDWLGYQILIHKGKVDDCGEA